jgi:hypothetical protein
MKPLILTFNFFDPEGVEHECRIEFDWLGTERYHVDGVLLLRQWSLLGKTALFSANGVEIQIRTRITGRTGVTQVLLDGLTAYENLLSHYYQEQRDERTGKLNRLDIGKRKPRTWENWVGKALLWFALAYGFFIFFKWLDRTAT